MMSQLRLEKWDPQRSSSRDPKLGTYFTAACAIQFRDVYKAWHAKRVKQMREHPLEPAAVGNYFTNLHDPADIATNRFRLHQILKTASLEELVICAGLLEDKPRAEIAEALGIGSRALEGRLYRLRQRTWESLGASPVRRRKNQKQESA